MAVLLSWTLWASFGPSQFSEGVERYFLLGGSFEHRVSFSQVKQRLSNVQETFYKSLVEVDEPKEGLDLLFVTWSWPFGYSSHIGWIHLDRVIWDYHSKVFNGGLLKFTLLWFKGEPCCWRSSMTLRTILWCSPSIFVNIRMSSKYTTTTPSEMRSLKIPSIMVWKVAGLLVRPKNITSGS